MRFCMVTTFYPPWSFGGDAVFVEALSRGLAEAGHEVEVIHCLDSYRALAPRDTLCASVPAPSSAAVRVHTLSSRAGLLSPLATQQTGRPIFKAAALRRLLAAGRFDVIHFHNISLIGGPAVLGYGSALKLYTIHEHWLLCPMHTLFRDNRELCTEKHCIRCALRYARPPQLWRNGPLLARSVAKVDAFLAATDFTRRLHLASGLPLRIEHLESFHQPPSPQPSAALPDRPFFLYAGRLERLKGVADLIDAFAAVPGVDLLIAGEGRERAALEARAGGTAPIRFLGQVPRDQLAAVVGRALAVVVPSIAYEVFPQVMLEAFAAGTPVIARDRGPLGEIIQMSGGGVLFRDTAELVARLRQLAGDGSTRRALGEAGQRTWQRRWTLAAHLHQYLELIAGLQAERGKGIAA
jgi:glycosyltransferase involved in cell wall biosynthesis